MSDTQVTSYPEAFKRSAVALVKASDQSLSHIAQHLGVDQSALYRWMEPYAPAANIGAPMDLAAEAQP